MNLVKIHNNWRKDTLYIDINLGNYCNHKCWYCWPESNLGTHKFPDLEILKTNITHLIDYYKNNTDKKIFDVHFCGGEPTHWKDLPEFIKFLKEKFNCLISMTSNGSKKMEWWKVNGKYFNRIHMSCHHEYVNLEEFRNICDYLYDINVVASASVMMDPFAWDKCINIVEYLKKSRRQWTIRYVDIIDPTVKYTDEQQKILLKHRARRVNLWFFWKNNKYYRSKVTVTDDKGKKYKFQDNEIILKKLNNFYGWECTAGVNWVDVSMKGVISATCHQQLYGEQSFYNLYDLDFVKKFNPKIQPVICTKTSCVCGIESVMPKKRINNKKIIPIYAN